MGRRKQRLPQQERHAKLLALLRREGTVRIATLAKVFDVTTETARRDLAELAQNNALKRTYGGGGRRSLMSESAILVSGRAPAAPGGLSGAAAAGMGGPGDARMVASGA